MEPLNSDKLPVSPSRASSAESAEKSNDEPAADSGLQAVDVEKKSPEKAKKFSENELEFLNLVAELIVEIILRETRNERDRICTDQH